MKRKKIKIKVAQKILNTAFNCLSTRGYAAVTMRNIAHEAGVALGQVTYYYKSKEHLFLEVINMMVYQYLEEIETKLAAVTDESQKLPALKAFFEDLIQNNPNLFKLFIDFTAQSLWIPSFREKVNSLFEELAKIIESNLILDKTKEKHISSDSSKNTAKLILGALYGTSIQHMLGSDTSISFEPMKIDKASGFVI